MSDGQDVNKDSPEWSEDVPVSTVTPKSKQKPSSLPSFLTPAVKETVKVRLLNTNIYEGRYLVRDESGKGYLVPTDELQWDSGWQDIEKRDLEAADQPYDLDSEIRSLFVTPAQVKQALWSMGIVTQEDAQKADLREMVAKALLKGVLPMVEEK